MNNIAQNQAAHERRTKLASAGLFELQRGQIWVPITAKEARKELAAGRQVYKYDTKFGPVLVEEI